MEVECINIFVLKTENIIHFPLLDISFYQYFQVWKQAIIGWAIATSSPLAAGKFPN